MPRPTIMCLAILLGLVGPATAYGCSQVPPTTFTPHISSADVRLPVRHVSSMGDWNVGASMSSFPVTLDQQIRQPRTGRTLTAAFAQQRSIRIEHPLLRAYDTFRSDVSGACNLDGTARWTTPRVLVREEADAVYITMVARDRGAPNEHCDLQGISTCTSESRMVRLSRPIGSRTLYLSRFARPAAI